jgi:hypothetical protein
MIRVLVCGGRRFDDYKLIGTTLDAIAADLGISCLIEGGSDGADALAMAWARARGIMGEMYPADWANLGRRAGPERNARMLEQGKPDLVVAFPGGAGTADMVRRARAAGVEIMEVK